MKTKTGLETASAFNTIFDDGRIPDKIQFDDGREFYNKNVKELLENNNIKYFSTFSDKKPAIIERLNRTIKSRMYKYFTENETRKWINNLDNFVKGYNNSYIIQQLKWLVRKLVNEKIMKLFAGCVWSFCNSRIWSA